MTRFYRFLLWLYPASVRTEYGEELTSIFAAKRANAAGFLGACGTIAVALVDIVPNAVAAHFDILRQDLVYTTRALRRAPGFAITAILVVALGVGANTAAFSVADFVLLRPLPFPNPQQLITVLETAPGYSVMELSLPNYRDFKTATTSFSGFGAYTSGAANLVTDNEPARVGTSLVTHDLLSVVGVQPMMGRLFTAEDTLANNTAVISFDLWQTHFGGVANVLGKRVMLDGAPYVVIGIMPRQFHFPTRDVSVWLPYNPSPQDAADRANKYLYGVARLRDGVTLDQARAELGTIAQRLEREYPKTNEKTGTQLKYLSDDFPQRTRMLLLALCGAALSTLLLACANLGNLLLARAVSREREIVVRSALGAGRERLIRQLVTESFVLVLLGGVVGVLVAMFAVPSLARLVPLGLPIADQPSVDLRVLAFAAITVAATGLVFGVVPALQTSGARSLSALRDGTRTLGGARRRLRSALVMVEVTVSVALLVSSGLLIRAMWSIQAIDPGFTASGVLTLQTALSFPEYNSVTTRTRFYDRVLRGVRALPGVSNAAYITGLPMTWRGGIWPVLFDGREPIRDGSNAASLRFATPGYFETLSIPILQGRDIEETDDIAHPFAAVVSSSFAKRYWPNEDPIGKRFFFAFRERTVVGVVGDVRVRGLEQASEPQVYIPSKQAADGMLVYYAPKDLAIRSSVPVEALMPSIRRIIREADPKQPITRVRSMQEIVSDETASRAAQLRVLGILAAVALLLAGVGLHGLLSFSVSNRTREIGVRVALGARPGRIVRMVAGEGLALTLGGLVPGLLLAYWGGRTMQALLVGVTPVDPLTFLIAITLCLAAAIAGSLRPALHAARIDPATALRGD